MLDMYKLYSLAAKSQPIADDIDKIVNELTHINNYDQVKNFISTKFNHKDHNDDLIRFYPDLNKNVVVNFLENAIEVFVKGGDKLIFAKGWRTTAKESV